MSSWCKYLCNKESSGHGEVVQTLRMCIMLAEQYTVAMLEGVLLCVCSFRIVVFIMFCFVAAWETRVQLGEIFVKGAVSESGGTGEKLEHLLASKRSGSARCSVLWWPVAGCQLCVRKCWLFRLMCSCSIRLWCTSPVSLCCVYRYFPAVDWGGRGILSWCAFFFQQGGVHERSPVMWMPMIQELLILSNSSPQRYSKWRCFLWLCASQSLQRASFVSLKRARLFSSHHSTVFCTSSLQAYVWPLLCHLQMFWWS